MRRTASGALQKEPWCGLRNWFWQVNLRWAGKCLHASASTPTARGHSHSHGKHYRELDWLTPIPQRRARPRQTRPEVADLAHPPNWKGLLERKSSPKVDLEKISSQISFFKHPPRALVSASRPSRVRRAPQKSINNAVACSPKLVAKIANEEWAYRQVEVTPNCNQIAYNHALHFIHIGHRPRSLHFARPGHPPVRVRARAPAHALLMLTRAVTHALSR